MNRRKLSTDLCWGMMQWLPFNATIRDQPWSHGMHFIWRRDLWENDWYGERAGVSCGTGTVIGVQMGAMRWHFALHFLPQLLLCCHQQAKTEGWVGVARGEWRIKRDRGKGEYKKKSKRWTMADHALQLPLPHSNFFAKLCPRFSPPWCLCGGTSLAALCHQAHSKRPCCF